MTIKEELHSLVDQLAEERAEEALAMLRDLAADSDAGNGPTTRGLARTMGPPAESGRSFFAAAPTSITSLAEAQGVRPVVDFNALLGDFWPEDETADDFVAAVREWRREGRHG